jgi:hypothetical protein
MRAIIGSHTAGRTMEPGALISACIAAGALNRVSLMGQGPFLGIHLGPGHAAPGIGVCEVGVEQGRRLPGLAAHVAVMGVGDDQVDQLQRQARLIQAAERRQAISEDIASIDASEKQINADMTRLKEEVDGYKKESDSLSQMLKDGTGLEAPYEDLRNAQKLAEATYQDLLRKQQLADANSQLI